MIGNNNQSDPPTIKSYCSCGERKRKDVEKCEACNRKRVLNRACGSLAMTEPNDLKCHEGVLNSIKSVRFDPETNNVFTLDGYFIGTGRLSKDGKNLKIKRS